VDDVLRSTTESRFVRPSIEIVAAEIDSHAATVLAQSGRSNRGSYDQVQLKARYYEQRLEPLIGCHLRVLHFARRAQTTLPADLKLSSSALSSPISMFRKKTL
jgi:hypothetical protein